VEYGVGADDQEAIDALRSDYPEVADVLTAQREFLIAAGTKLWAFDGANLVTYLQVTESLGDESITAGQVRDDLLRQLSGIPVSSEAISLPAGTAEVMIAHVPSSATGPVVYEIYVLVDQGVVFTFNFSTDEGSYKAEAPLFRSVAESIRITQP
jgi:hypothetical protein